MKKEHFYIVQSETYIELMKTNDILEIPLDATIIEAEDTSTFMPSGHYHGLIDTITLPAIPGVFFNAEYSVYLGEYMSTKSPLKSGKQLVPRLYRTENLKLHTTKSNAEYVLHGISRANRFCIDSRTTRNPLDFYTTGFWGGLIFAVDHALQYLQLGTKGSLNPYISDNVLALLRPLVVQKNSDIIKSYVEYFSKHKMIDPDVFSDIDYEHIADSILIDNEGNRSKVHYNKICNTESGERLFFSIIGPTICVTMLSPPDKFNKAFLQVVKKTSCKAPAQLHEQTISEIKSVISPDISLKFSSNVNIKLRQPQKKEEKRLFLKDLKNYKIYNINLEIKKIYSSLTATKEDNSGTLDTLIANVSRLFVNKYGDYSLTADTNVLENIVTVVSGDATLVAEIEKYQSLQTSKLTTIRRALFNEIRNQLGMTKKKGKANV